MEIRRAFLRSCRDEKPIAEHRLSDGRREEVRLGVQRSNDFQCLSFAVVPEEKDERVETLPSVLLTNGREKIDVFL